MSIWTRLKKWWSTDDYAPRERFIGKSGEVSYRKPIRRAKYQYSEPDCGSPSSSYDPITGALLGYAISGNVTGMAVGAAIGGVDGGVIGGILEHEDPQDVIFGGGDFGGAGAGGDWTPDPLPAVDSSPDSTGCSVDTSYDSGSSCDSSSSDTSFDSGSSSSDN